MTVDHETLGQSLRAALDEARASWPAIELPAEEVIDYLGERADQQLPPAEALAALRTTDLYLACGCSRGLPAALAAFEATYPPRLLPALSRLGVSPDLAQETMQRLRLHLFVGEGARIRSYRGRGSLSGWLRVTARRLALAESPELAVSLDLETRVASAAVPAAELGLLCRRYLPDLREIVKREVATVLATLSPQERNLMRWHLVEEIPLRQLARVRGVNVSTLSRELARVRSRIDQRIQDGVAARTGLPPAEVRSIMVALISGISFSLGTQLALSVGDEAGPLRLAPATS